MELSLFLSIILFIFIILNFIIAQFMSLRIKNLNDYFLANKQLQTFSLTLTLLTNQIGGNFLYGITQQAYLLGYYAIFYALGINLGFVLLACGIAKKLKTLCITTTATLFENVFQSNILHKLASLGSIISLWMILTNTIALLSAIFIALNIGNSLIIFLFWLLVIINIARGGLASIALLDVIKQFFIATIFIGIFLYNFVDNIHTAFHLFDLINIQDLFPKENFYWQNLFQNALLFSFFSLMQQDLAQCFFAAKNVVVAAKAARYTVFGLLFFSLMPLYFGMQARLFNVIPMINNISPIVLFLQTINDSRLLALLLIAIVCVITATTSALICAIGSNILQDFNIKKENKNPVWLAQRISFIIGAAALVTSYVIPLSMLTHLSQIYKLYVSAFFIPTLLCYFYKELPAYIAWTGILTGTTGFLITSLIAIPILGELAPLLACATAIVLSLFFKGLYNL